MPTRCQALTPERNPVTRNVCALVGVAPFRGWRFKKQATKGDVAPAPKP